MAEHAAELTGIAFILAVAAIAGIGFLRLGQPPIVGYILAGIGLGPTGIGLVSNTGNVALLAELGVILLLFLVGMEISVVAFMSVLRPATLTAAGQIIIGLGISLVLGYYSDWPVEQSILVGFVVALSSTAVAMKMLEEVGDLRSRTGRITIGVLIAQDIAIVPMLILVGSLGNLSDANWVPIITKLAVAVVILGFIFRHLGRVGKIRLPFTDAVRGKPDVLALGAVAFCFAAAAASSIAGLSPAYGAFLAGLVVAHSTLRTEAVHVTHPIQSVFVVIFFLSIGLLIDLDYAMANLTTVLLFVGGVIIAKTVINIAILHWVGEPWERAFPAGLMMAQIGEFSFVLVAAGFRNDAIDPNGYKLAVTVIAITLLVSPVWMSILRKFHDVASHGITDFRTALAETYHQEVEQIGYGAHAMKRGVRRLRIAGRRRRHAARWAWKRARERRRTAEQADDMRASDGDRSDGSESTASADKAHSGIREKA